VAAAVSAIAVPGFWGVGGLAVRVAPVQALSWNVWRALDSVETAAVDCFASTSKP
jgi:hypothetical protein